MAEIEDAPITPRLPGQQWTTRTLKEGERETGVLVGPIRRIACHWDEDLECSKPCRDVLTKGAVPCYCAKTHQRTTVRVYVPILDKKGEQLVMLISATSYKRIAALPHATVLVFNRVGVNISRTYANYGNPFEFEQSILRRAQQLAPQDISDYLVYVLWQDPKLIAHYDKVANDKLTIPKLAVKQPWKKNAVDAPPVAPQNAPAVASIVLNIGLDPNT